MGRSPATPVHAQELADCLSPFILRPKWIEYSEQMNAAVDTKNILALKLVWRALASRGPKTSRLSQASPP
jgi:hypothetical protein